MSNCKFLGCKKQPTYGFENGKAEYCFEHKQTEMIDIKHEKCKFLGCKKRPNFGLENHNERYCFEHKLPEMIDIQHKKCKSVDCKKRSTFGLENGKAEYCFEHKKENMVNLADKKCKFSDCKKRPTFGFENSVCEYCFEHKLPEMINIRDKKCKFLGCKKQPTFGLESGKTEYCFEHKLPEMVDVKSKRCKFLCCKKHPTYGFENGKAEYCFEHKEGNMVDVKSKRCINENCSSRANYGELFKQKTHCSKHKTPNMFRQNKPTCKDCPADAYFAPNQSNYPVYCENHAPKGYFNLVEKPCKKCGLSYLLGSTGLCNFCLEFEQKIHHKKENEIKKCLDFNKIIYESHDKVIDPSCNMKRPDFVIDYPMFKIVVEVDENQHKSYACECEQVRMIQIHQSFGGTPVIFVRYNPDEFSTNGKKCEVTEGTRRKVLIDLLQQYRNVKEWTTPLSVIYLFYDDYDEKLNALPIVY